MTGYNLSRRIRAILGADAFLLAAISGVYVVDPLYNRLKGAGLADIISWVTLLIVFGSTLFATIVFLQGALRKPSAAVVGTRRAMISDGVLLLSWWVVLSGLCIYGYLLGLGG